MAKAESTTHSEVADSTGATEALKDVADDALSSTCCGSCASSLCSSRWTVKVASKVTEDAVEATEAAKATETDGRSEVAEGTNIIIIEGR